MYDLRLTIYVCTKDEIANNACPVCDTLSCYEKGLYISYVCSDCKNNYSCGVLRLIYRSIQCRERK